MAAHLQHEPVLWGFGARYGQRCARVNETTGQAKVFPRQANLFVAANNRSEDPVEKGAMHNQTSAGS